MKSGTSLSTCCWEAKVISPLQNAVSLTWVEELCFDFGTIFIKMWLFSVVICADLLIQHLQILIWTGFSSTVVASAACQVLYILGYHKTQCTTLMLMFISSKWIHCVHHSPKTWDDIKWKYSGSGRASTFGPKWMRSLPKTAPQPWVSSWVIGKVENRLRRKVKTKMTIYDR